MHCRIGCRTTRKFTSSLARWLRSLFPCIAHRSCHSPVFFFLGYISTMKAFPFNAQKKTIPTRRLVNDNLVRQKHPYPPHSTLGEWGPSEETRLAERSKCSGKLSLLAKLALWLPARKGGLLPLSPLSKVHSSPPTPPRLNQNLKGFLAADCSTSKTNQCTQSSPIHLGAFVPIEIKN